MLKNDKINSIEKSGVDFMRKVCLSVLEEEKYLTIKKIVETNGNKRAAALKLNCTVRHINRMIKGYKEKGKAFFMHGNRGRKPTNTIPEKTTRRIVGLYQTKYPGTNFKHYAELLLRIERIAVSPGTIHSILAGEGILSPKATRKTKARMKEQLVKRITEEPSVREQTQLKNRLVSLEEAHPRKPRAAYFGETVQMDASQYLWFGDKTTHLHASIDDCSGSVLGAFFDEQETLWGYYNVTRQVIRTYGIPYSFLTDRRTVFEYKKKNTEAVEKDSFTQFSYACKQLGIELNTTSVPESKGRIERLFQTLQSRLPIELKLAGVTTVEQANLFLKSYIKEFNAQFALDIHNTKSAFETPLSDEKLNLILSVISNRKFDCGHSIRFEKKYYRTVTSDGIPGYFHKGTPCLVIKAFSGQLFGCVADTVYAFEEIPEHMPCSPNFQPLSLYSQAVKPKKTYIPPMDHPWRLPVFQNHLNSMYHRLL